MKISPAALTSVLLLSSIAYAQQPEADEEAAKPQLETIAGPADGPLSDIATIKVPEGVEFVARDQMALLNKLTGNMPSPSDVGALLWADRSIVFFTWDPVGYVADDEREELNADEMLEAMQSNEKESNERRRAAGLDPLFIDGWQTPPFYDVATNNLTWALKLSSGAPNSPEPGVNHEIRLLGRDGVMRVTWVGDPKSLATAVPELQGQLKNFAFNPGKTYAEFRKGDKMAEYGLTGLVLGGGALLASKLGLFAKLGKFIKVIAIGGIAVVGAAFNWIKRRTNGEA